MLGSVFRSILTVAHSFGYGDLGSGRQMEREEQKEKGDPQPIPDLQSLGEKALCWPPRRLPLPNQTVLSMSILFPLATQVAGRSET